MLPETVSDGNGTERSLANEVGQLPMVAQDIVIDSVTSSVDFLTITVTNPGKSVLLMQEAQRLKGDLEGCGWKVKKWGMKGYAGYRIAGMAWGMRHDGCIMMLSGQDAAVNWLPALALAENVTRVDLAATVALEKPFINVAKMAYARAITDPERCQCKRRKYSYVENSAGGQTCYIGSRISDQFGRIYDKGLESEKDACASPGLIWRYEVEFKSYRAKKLARQMEASARAETETVAEAISHLVYTWFRARGIPPIFNDTPADTDWIVELEARITDDEASLNWLTVQVRPSVERLLEHGREAETLEALGIHVVHSKMDAVET